MHKEEANRSQLPPQRLGDVLGAATGHVSVHVVAGAGYAPPSVMRHDPSAALGLVGGGCAAG
ncbi:MAG TPA: hypothetical protein VFI90_07850 [Rubrobacter sp.]|nr:hypothetical protein [Rubrobacter sp.]